MNCDDPVCLSTRSHPASADCDDECPTWLNSKAECTCPTAPAESLHYADGCVGEHDPDANPICAGHLNPTRHTVPAGGDA